MRVIITTHAAQRYQERVRPTLDVLTAKNELERLVVGASLSPQPLWPIEEDVENGGGFLILTPEIFSPLKEIGDSQYVMTTVLAHGDLSVYERKRRNDRKRKHRAFKRRRREAGRPTA